MRCIYDSPLMAERGAYVTPDKGTWPKDFERDNSPLTKGRELSEVEDLFTD